MKKIASLIITAALCISNALAAPQAPKTAKGAYNIQLSVGDVKNDTVFLAYYMNGKTYMRDTTLLDSKGNGTFTKDKPLDEGIYIVYFRSKKNGDKYFDLMVGSEKNFKINVDTAHIRNVKITGSPISAGFQDYMEFLTEMNKSRSELVKEYKDKKIDSTTFSNRLNEMTNKVEGLQKEVTTTHSNNFLGAYIKGTIPVETPEFKEVPDSIRSRVRYQYFKHHYFDNIDLSDQRFLRTPYFPQMVDTYISKHILQDPDTLAETAFELIEKSRGDSITFQSMTSKMINYGISSNQMGMDALWFKIAERYYFNGVATWADSSWVESLRKEAKKIRHNLIGMQARELKMRDTSDNRFNLSDVKSELVLVYFFEPTCGHCKKTTPILHDSVYTKWKDKGFEVFACYTQTDRVEWMQFIKKNHMEDWINVWDPHRESWFWEWYDTSATPGLYLLNKDRKIIAKKIDMQTLDMILENELVKRKEANKEAETSKDNKPAKGKK